MKPAPFRSRLLSWFTGYHTVWVVLGLGLLFSGAVSQRFHGQVMDEEVAIFQGEANRLDQAVIRRMDEVVGSLRAAQGFFDATVVDAEAWKAFTARFGPERHFAGLRALGYADRVSAGDLRRFEARLEQEIGLPMRMDPPGAPFGFYSRFLESGGKEQPQLLNRNLFSEPNRRDAIRRAISEDLPAATGPITLMGAIDPRDRTLQAMALYLPVYRRGAKLGDAIERWEATQGVLYTALIFEEFFGLLQVDHPNVGLMVQDLGSGNLVLHQGNMPGRIQTRFKKETLHRIGGRTWGFTYARNMARGDLREDYEGYLIFAVGAILSLACAALVLGLLREHRKAEGLVEKVHGNELRLKRLTEQAPCGILLLSGGRVDYANSFAEDTLHLPRKSLQGRLWTDLVHPMDLPSEAAAFFGADPPDAPFRVEARMLPGEGEIWADLTLGSLRDGPRTQVLVTFFDTTERRRAEGRRLDEERRVSESRRLESLGTMAAGLAHDFNNLLGVILGRVELEGHREDPAVQAAFHKARDLSHQLLVFSRGQCFEPKKVNLLSLVRSFVEERRLKLPQGVRLDLSLPANLDPVAGQSEALRQILGELWSNAQEALLDLEGTLKLELSSCRLEAQDLPTLSVGNTLPPGDYARLSVEDTGRGMDAQQMARIFDPFFSTKFVGRGLGLPVVATLVKTHQGGIRVKSHPGRGTRLEVFLPLRHDLDATGTFGGTPPGTRRGRTVLVVDDEPGIREVASEALRMVGYEVLEASGGQAALSMLEQYPEIGLMILDMAMPDLTGAEVLEAMRAQPPSGVKVVLSSGYAEEALRSSIQPNEIEAFLPKPYRVVQLQDLARRLIGSPDGS